MERRSSGDVTSTETHRLVFLERMIDIRHFAREFCVVNASDSYEAIHEIQSTGTVCRSYSYIFK